MCLLKMMLFCSMSLRNERYLLSKTVLPKDNLQLFRFHVRTKKLNLKQYWKNYTAFSFYLSDQNWLLSFQNKEKRYATFSFFIQIRLKTCFFVCTCVRSSSLKQFWKGVICTAFSFFIWLYSFFVINVTVWNCTIGRRSLNFNLKRFL